MKALIRIITVILMASLTLSGCDAFRRIAGRPTSKDIEAKRRSIEEYEASRRSLEDSTSAELISEPDSTVSVDSTVIDPHPVKEDRTTEQPQALQSRYYIVVGSFSSVQLAEKLASKAEKQGFPSTLIKMKSGMTAVGVSPSNDYIEAQQLCKIVKKQDFAKNGAWIYSSDKQ